MKKEKAIILIVNKSYLFAASTLLVNLKSFGNKLYDDIVIYHDNIPENEISLLYKIEPNIKFINYALDAWVAEHKSISSNLAKSFLNKYSHLAWSKYKVFEQLEFYKKIVYLDLDILVKEDFSTLYQINNGIAWRSGQNFHGKFGHKPNLLHEIADVPKNYPSLNGGFFYATDTIDHKKFCDDARAFTIKYLDYFASALDELAIAWATFKNNLTLTELSELEYNTLPAQYDIGCKIVHFMGEEKLWNNELLQAIFPEWKSFYRKAEELTSFSSDKVKIYSSIGKLTRKKLNEERWFNLLRKANLNIPNYLHLEYDFSNEWLILRYKSDIYYEFKFSQFQSGYSVALWIRNKFYINDKNIKNKLSSLVENNSVLNKNEDERGIYIYTNRVNISEVSNLFDYFISQTIHLF